jgi:hypothetical protein
LIGHDNSGLGPGWFVDKVIISEEKSQKKWFFLMGRWLAKDMEDGLIEREVPASTVDGVVRRISRTIFQWNFIVFGLTFFF